MLNNIIMMGRLVNAPELRATNSGVKVASFRIACDRDYSAEGQEKQTDFIDCVAWRATGEFVCRNFVKGQMIAIDGRLQSRKWQDRDGNNRITWEINVSNAYFAGGNRNRDAGEAPKASADSSSPLVDLGNDDSDLPWNNGDDLPM
jgi:single-strand DNA-binding protein